MKKQSKPIPNSSNKNSLDFLNKHKDKFFLALLVLISGVVIYFRLQLQIKRGPGWDTYSFLLNALEFAGKGKDFFEIYRPPLLSFIVSFFFRLGFESASVIFFVDAGFTLLGVIGLFYLLRLRLSASISFLGGLLFLSFPDVMESLTTGITDIAAISISIWVVYFAVRSVEEDSNYLKLAIPLWVLALITRFTAGFMVLPIFFYILIRPKARNYLINIFRGSFWSLIILMPYSVYFWYRLGDPFIQFGEPFKAAEATQRIGLLAGTIEGPTYFLNNFLGFLSNSPLAFVFLALLIWGFFVFASELLQHKKETFTVGSALLFCLAGALLSVLFFIKVSPTAVSIIWFVFLGALVSALFDIDYKAGIGLVFLYWFVVFFNTHSHMLVKITRYYITMIPPVIFFSLLGLEKLKSILQNTKRVITTRFVFTIASVLVMVLIGFSTYFSYGKVLAMKDWGVHGESETKWFNRAEKRQNLTIVADNFVAWRWYLRREVLPMPPVKGGQPFIRHKLEELGADYYFTGGNYGQQFGAYKLVKKTKTVIIYKKIGPRPSGRKDILLIGKDLNNFIYNVVGFDYYLTRKQVPYPDAYADRTYSYIDKYSLEELARYDATILYSFRWNHLKNAQDLLKRYVARGGTLVIDASKNMEGLNSNLDRSNLFGVSVRRKALPKKPLVAISDNLLADNVRLNEFSPFLTESKEAWFGTTYAGKDLKVLASIDGDTLVGVQYIGRGKIIWLGYNIFFHAFYYKNYNEKLFIKNIFKMINEKAFR